MKERPILMSGPLVRETREGNKRQTRRVIIPRGDRVVCGPAAEPYHAIVKPQFGMECLPCPYGVPGDRLWVREAWRVHRDYNSLPPSLVKVAMGGDTEGCVEYEATPRGLQWPGKLRPSIHMPRWASRMMLEVTDVRVQRVQDISAEDALAEGTAVRLHQDASEYPPSVGLCFQHPVDSFRTVWDSLNEARGYEWDENPWVWAVTFRVL